MQKQKNFFPKMVQKNMKIEVWGGLGGSGRRLGSLLEPRWRPRSPRGAPRGARKPNTAPKMGQLGSKMGSQICSKIIKNRFEKTCFFLLLFLIDFRRDLGPEIDENRCKGPPCRPLRTILDTRGSSSSWRLEAQPLNPCKALAWA